MAFSIPWLETVSKRERQRREEKAQRLMFPFGDEQRTAELAVLRALIQTKARDADLLYQLFQAKDCLRPMQDEMPEEQQERLAAWLTSQLARSFNRQNAQCLRHWRNLNGPCSRWQICLMPTLWPGRPSRQRKNCTLT